MPEVIKFEDVCFRYPDEDKWILDKVSLSIKLGEKVVITGPSGSGKTTLLYVCNRLYPDNCDGIMTGSVKLFGRESSSYAQGEVNHRVATVFQDPDAQFCMLTVEEELAFTLENLDVDRSVMAEKIDAVLTMTGLIEFRHAVIQQLSGGEKQRIATACALIMEPDVLLLDEPISHLDPYTARKFIAWLDELQNQKGFTVVAIEHRLDLWGTFFDRAIELQSMDQIPRLEKRKSSRQVEQSLLVQDVSTPYLKKTSFHLQKGEVAVLAGPNGSGKSTLLKALCQLIPAKGSVVPEQLGYVPQSPEFLFVTKSVEDEVAFGGVADVQDMLERLYLKRVAEAHPFAVSHGQKRRVAIAAMLCDGREVILMDEPTSGQDAAALFELFQLIDERARNGATFVIVTHDMEFAYAIADSVLLMDQGELTGKFEADRVWANEGLLLAHHLLQPKGCVDNEVSYA